LGSFLAILNQKQIVVVHSRFKVGPTLNPYLGWLQCQVQNGFQVLKEEEIMFSNYYITTPSFVPNFDVW
jgi:hypothetical protein